MTGQLVATDGNPADILTFMKVSGPSWLTVSATGALGGIPLNTDVGSNSFRVRVTDQVGASAETTIIVSVENVNHAPAFTSNPVLVADASENAPYTGQSLAGKAVDPDAGDSLTYSKVSGPEWLIVAPSGELTGTPPKGSAGLNTFVIRVADSATSADAELQHQRRRTSPAMDQPRSRHRTTRRISHLRFGDFHPLPVREPSAALATSSTSPIKPSSETDKSPLEFHRGNSSAACHPSA